MTLRTAGVLLAFLIGLSACGAAQQPGASADPGAGEADASAPTASAPLPSLDRERQAALLAEGLSEGEAEFLALTTLESEALGDNTYRVLATFPTGDVAELTITLKPDQTGDPADLEFSHAVVGDDFEFRLAYLVPWDAIPTELHDDIRQGGTALLQPDALLAFAPVEVAADSEGVGVVVEAVVTELYQQTAEQTAEIIDKRFGNQIDASGTLKMLDALKGVANALGSSADYLDLVRELDALEKCASNPTNPITKRKYGEDPAYRQQILDQVDSTRSEVKANFFVMYLSHMIDTGSGAFESRAVGVIVGAGTAWSEAAIKEVTRKLIDDLAKNITRCEEVCVGPDAPTAAATPPPDVSVQPPDRTPEPAPTPIPGDPCNGYRIEGTIQGNFTNAPGTSLTFSGFANRLDPDSPSSIVGEGTMSGTLADCVMVGGGDPKPMQVELDATVMVTVVDDVLMASILPEGGGFLLSRSTDLMPIEGGTYTETERFEEGEQSSGCGSAGTTTIEWTVTPTGEPPSP